MDIDRINKTIGYAASQNNVGPVLGSILLLWFYTDEEFDCWYDGRPYDFDAIADRARAAGVTV